VLYDGDMNQRSIFLGALGLAAILSASAAHADAPSPAAEPSITISISPLHLVLPIVELTAEVKVAPGFGVAVIGGAGTLKASSGTERYAAIEGGVNARYYLTGAFHGVELGAEALYVHVANSATDVTAQAAGLAVGPYAGYKWIQSSGLTLEAQLGVDYLTARADAMSGTTSASSSTSAWGPLLNLQAGWSF
jgi:hypothetical protein